MTAYADSYNAFLRDRAIWQAGFNAGAEFAKATYPEPRESGTVGIPQNPEEFVQALTAMGFEIVTDPAEFLSLIEPDDGFDANGINEFGECNDPDCDCHYDPDEEAPF